MSIWGGRHRAGVPRVVEYPPWADHTIRTVHCVTYLIAYALGLGAVLYTPVTLDPRIDDHLTNVWGTILAISAASAAVSVAAQRWYWELTSLFFVGGSVSVYMVMAWAALTQSITSISVAATATMLVCGVVTRLVQLMVLYLQSHRVARIKRNVGVVEDDQDDVY